MPSPKCQQVKGLGFGGELTGKRKSWEDRACSRASRRHPGNNTNPHPGNRVLQKRVKKSVGVEKDSHSKINARLPKGSHVSFSFFIAVLKFPRETDDHFKNLSFEKSG